jgi:hypothetical protein
VRQVVQKLVVRMMPTCLQEIIETMARVLEEQQEDFNRVMIIIDEEIVTGNCHLQPVLDQFYQHLKRKSWWKW